MHRVPPHVWQTRSGHGDDRARQAPQPIDRLVSFGALLEEHLMTHTDAQHRAFPPLDQLLHLLHAVDASQVGHGRAERSHPGQHHGVDSAEHSCLRDEPGVRPGLLQRLAHGVQIARTVVDDSDERATSTTDGRTRDATSPPVMHVAGLSDRLRHQGFPSWTAHVPHYADRVPGPHAGLEPVPCTVPHRCGVDRVRPTAAGGCTARH